MSAVEDAEEDGESHQQLLSPREASSRGRGGHRGDGAGATLLRDGGEPGMRT